MRRCWTVRLTLSDGTVRIFGGQEMEMPSALENIDAEVERDDLVPVGIYEADLFENIHESSYSGKITLQKKGLIPKS